jgi:hypothetical protein
MMTFSADPDEAAREMDGVLFHLAAFGWVDGHFDRTERDVVDDFILELAEALEPDDSTPTGRSRRAALVDRLDRRLQRYDAELAALWEEPTAEGERAIDYVRSRMKVRCFEIFEGLGPANRKALLAAIDRILHADGTAHHEEVAFRDELVALVSAGARRASDRPAPSILGGRRVFTHPHITWPRTGANHAALSRLEQHYASDADAFDRQLREDVQRIRRAMKTLEAKRAGNAGKLRGKLAVQQLSGSFLDGHIQVLQPSHPTGYELTVLGDLHGCYSCLKAALMQTDFLGKVERFTKAPTRHPEPLLVLLGDYIDRGLYSFQGVLRGVLELMALAPRHVVALRGNHEYFFDRDGETHAAVRPADALDYLKPYAPPEVLSAYRELFEALPVALFFDDILFVHGGIPRDATVRERWQDLSSLNDPTVRFQMLWSDPSEAALVPEELQASTNRFSFGRDQARAFLNGIGVRTMIRGHEKVSDGYVIHCDEPDLRILTLFSAGGADNHDLPPKSNYRKVIPSALTIRYRDGRTDIEPWVIDYATYLDPDLNGFYAPDDEG